MNTKKSSTYSMFIIGALFFVFGFVTWLNNILIPYMKTSCELTSQVQAYLVPFAFYIAYFVMSIPSSYVLKKTGYGNGMALGLIVMAIGCMLFVPGARLRSYPIFLTGLFIQGAGLSLLQTPIMLIRRAAYSTGPRTVTYGLLAVCSNDKPAPWINRPVRNIG